MSSIEGKWVARFVLAISAEFIYVAGRTWLIHHWPDGTAQELAWSAWRLPFIAIYWGLFRAFIFSAPARPMPRHPLLYLAIALALVGVPVGARSPDWDYRLVLALASPIVGLREELIYRGIVQGFLERAFGPVRAMFAASVIFLAFHYGAQPFTASSATTIFALGFVLGAIYQRTRNLWLVAALHAAVDFIWPLAPQWPVAPEFVVVAGACAVVGAVGWWGIDRNARN